MDTTGLIGIALFGLGLVVTAILAVRWGRRLDAKDAADVDHREADDRETLDRIRNAETFGHPLPPVASLRAVLPDPPQHHAWEIHVQYDAVGVPHVVLALLTLPGTAVVDSVWFDLYQRRDGGRSQQPWAAYYRALPGHDDALREFKHQVLGPLMDWARLAVYRIERPDDYEIRA